jgi:hypothetical protein
MCRAGGAKIPKCQKFCIREKQNAQICSNVAGAPCRSSEETIKMSEHSVGGSVSFQICCSLLFKAYRTQCVYVPLWYTFLLAQSFQWFQMINCLGQFFGWSE